MRILFLSPYVPSRVRVRPYSWIRALAAQGHEVHLVALRPPEDEWASDAELRGVCATVDVLPLSRSRTLANGLLTLASPRPLQLAYAHSPGAERHVRRLANRGGYDVVHVEHLRGVSLASEVAHLPRVWDAVDCISDLFADTARHAPGRAQRVVARLDLARTRRFEARAPLLFDETLVTSPADATAFIRLSAGAAADRVTVVPNGVDTDYFQRDETTKRDAIVFTGKLSYHANAAAVLRLVTRIMPRVWAANPDTPVVVAGKDPPDGIRALAADPRVTVTGYLDDLRPVFARALVAACPLVYGAGIQNKVLEAMACGVPVVTTSAAAAALLAAPEGEVCVADDDSQFATVIGRLLDRADLRQAIGAAGRNYVEREHQWPRLASRLISLYDRARVTASQRARARTAPPSHAHAARG